jgi:hypothetical protein
LRRIWAGSSITLAVALSQPVARRLVR